MLLGLLSSQFGEIICFDCCVLEKKCLKKMKSTVMQYI